MLYDLVIIILQTQSGRPDVRPLQESKYLGRLIIDTNIQRLLGCFLFVCLTWTLKPKFCIPSWLSGLVSQRNKSET